MHSREKLKKDCIFCNCDNIIAKVGTVFAIKDQFPVTQGHHLIIPFKHSNNYFEMNEIELHDSLKLLYKIKNILASSDSTITGFNIGVNSGLSAGQTIMHSHIHLIPRRNGDTDSPRGGVRGVIPEKMAY
tara:strand:- start:813 stop:1202 length:390 start_codon:yes stop_codon:yes gene_type:complete